MSLASLISRGRVVACMSLMTFSNVLFADESNQSDVSSSSIYNNNTAFTRVSPTFLWGNTHFKFDSTYSNIRSNFHGDTQLYAFGGDRIPMLPTLDFGLFIYRTITHVSSQISGDVPLASQTWKTMHNTTLFVHITKKVNPFFDLDLAGAYGQNHTNNQLTFPLNEDLSAYSQARNNLKNWFSSIIGIYKKTSGNFLFKMYIGLLYSSVKAEGYTYVFNAIEKPKQVAGMRSQSMFVPSMIELSYKITPAVTPFINFGAMHVLSTSNRPGNGFIALNTATPLPQVNMNGFSVGGGLSFKWRAVTLRVGERAYYAGGSYTSYQTLVGLKYAMD